MAVVAPTVSRQIEESVRDTLIAYLPGVLPEATGCNYRFQPEDFDQVALLAPVIFIFGNDGYEQGDITLAAKATGFEFRSYPVEIRVVLKGPDADTIGKSLQRWWDSIKAVLEAHDLEDIHATVAYSGGADRTVSFEVRSSRLMAIEGKIEVGVYVTRGNTTI